MVYGSASKTQLEKLNKIQAQDLRQCCGAVKSTSIQALEVLAGEMPLEMRRKQLKRACRAAPNKRGAARELGTAKRARGKFWVSGE